MSHDETTRQLLISKRQEFTGSPTHHPDVISFGELFTEVSYTKESAPKIPSQFIGSYCMIDTTQNGNMAYSHSVYVEPADWLFKWIMDEMLYECLIYFEVVVYECGFALVLAKYNTIIGSRYLAIIDSNTIPPKLAAPETNKPALKIPVDVLTLLSRSTVEGDAVKLPGMVDRKLYEQVNKILEMLGGKWNRKSQGHLFKEDPNPLIENVLLTGTIAKPEKFGYFPTPQLLAKQVVAKADISDGMTILEPSAGSGNLADIIAGLTAKENIYCCELQESNVALLEEKGYQVRSGDFQSVPPLPEFEVDRVVMNPPFERQQDIKHVMHAWNFVKPGGKLVAIMSSSFTFRGNSLSSDFRDFVDEYGHHCENPEGSFKASGTNVNTVTVVLDKPLSNREMLKAA